MGLLLPFLFLEPLVPFPFSLLLANKSEMRGEAGWRLTSVPTAPHLLVSYEAGPEGSGQSTAEWAALIQTSPLKVVCTTVLLYSEGGPQNHTLVDGHKGL